MTEDIDHIHEDSNAEDEVLRRLLELKELYKVQRDELSGEPNEENYVESRPEIKTKRPRSKSETKLSALQMVILQTMEEHGGLCHAETIIESVRLKWPELQRRDGSLYHTSDCRKIVYASLRGLDLFKQNEEEGYWGINYKWEDEELDDESNADEEAEGLLLLDLDSEFNKPAPMTDYITQAIEDKVGCEIEDIYDYVLRHWERPYLRRDVVNRGMTDDDIKESIQVILRTDPRYVRDPYNTNVFTVVYKHPGRKHVTIKGKSSPASVVPRGPSPNPPVKRRMKRSIPLTTLTLTPIAPVPPPNYKCLCGTSDPGGRAHKWHTQQGMWLCHACGVQWSKKSACPMCGKVYRNADAKYAIQNSWICCDDCHRWVMAKCDGIEDLSIYDDGNPNHIHYSCPLCRSIRKRQEEERLRPPAIVKTENESLSDVERKDNNSLSPLSPSSEGGDSPTNLSPTHPAGLQHSLSGQATNLMPNHIHHQSAPILIKPVNPIIPIQAIVQKPHSPIPTSSPPNHVPPSPPNHVINNHNNHHYNNNNHHSHHSPHFNNSNNNPHISVPAFPKIFGHSPKAGLGGFGQPTNAGFGGFGQPTNAGFGFGFGQSPKAGLGLGPSVDFNKKFRFEDVKERDEIDAMIKIGPPTKIPKNERIEIEPLVKVSALSKMMATSAPTTTFFPQAQSTTNLSSSATSSANFPPNYKPRSFVIPTRSITTTKPLLGTGGEDALVPSQEMTSAEVLSSMFSPPPSYNNGNAPPTFNASSFNLSSSAPNPTFLPHVPPLSSPRNLMTSPRGNLASPRPHSPSSSPRHHVSAIRTPIQVQSHPIQPFLASSPSPVQAQLLGSMMGLQLDCITPQTGIIQTIPSPQIGGSSSSTTSSAASSFPQFQPTGMLSFLTQPTQLLPVPVSHAQSSATSSATSALTQAQLHASTHAHAHAQLQTHSAQNAFIQAQFKAQPVSTCIPIKYDVIGGSATATPTTAPIVTTSIVNSTTSITATPSQQKSSTVPSTTSTTTTINIINNNNNNMPVGNNNGDSNGSGAKSDDVTMRDDVSNFEKSVNESKNFGGDMDLEQSSSNLEEDLRRFKESLEQERKALCHEL